MMNELDYLIGSRRIFFVLLILLIGTVFQNCTVLKQEKNQSGEYLFIRNNGNQSTFKANSFRFKRVHNTFVVTSSSIGGNITGVSLDYKFQMDERCHDFMRSDSVKYNVTKVSTKCFNVNGVDHRLYKFYYDEHASWDEEDLIIIHEDLGIIFIHRYWGERIELQYHPNLDIADLNALKKRIQADQTFYYTWDSCIWN